MKRRGARSNPSRFLHRGMAAMVRIVARAAARGRCFAVIGISLGISLGLSLAACSNLLTGNDLKDKVAPDVISANADSVAVTIQATPSSGGTLSLSGSVQVKAGVGFSLTATADSSYVFNNWSSSGSGGVSFSSTSDPTTTVTVKSATSGTVIKANFSARPKVVDYNPTDHATGVLKNQPIYIQFSQAMSPTALGDQIASYISVKGKVSGDASDPVDILDQFDHSLNSAQTTVTLTPKSSLNSSYKVFVAVAKSLPSSSGVTLADDDFGFFYTTGDKEDLSVPEFTAAPSISKGWTTPTAANVTSDSAYATNTKEIVITSDATSNSKTDSVSINAVEITETDLSIGPSSAVTKVYSYSTSMKYTLCTAGEGEKSISMTLHNSNGNTGTAASGGVSAVKVLLDTVAPAVNTLKLRTDNGSGIYAKAGNAIYLDVTASDTSASGETGSGMSTVASGAVSMAIGAASVDSGKLSLSSGVYTGEYTVPESPTYQGVPSYSVVVTDLAGNSCTAVTAGSSTNVIVDTIPPVLTASILEAAGAGDTAVATDGYVKNADYVTVKVESNETLRGYPSYAGSGAELKAATDMTAGGVLKATTYTSPAWHMMENGLETVEVMGTDLAGNSATSASVTVTVDNIAPVIALGVPSAAYINKDGTSSIAVTVSDANLPDSVGLTPGTEGDAGVSATLEQGAFGAGATSRTGTWVVRGAVGTGAYKVSIGAGALKDKAGNASVVAPSVTVTVDNTVPEIKGFTTPEYCNKADNYSVGVTVSASDTTSGMGSYEISGADLTATVSGTLSAAAGETGSDAKSIVFSSSTADGGKTVTLKVTDLAGNSASMSAVIKLDTTPPELSASILEAAGAGDTAVATDGYVKNADYVTVKVESNETLRGYPSYAGSGAELKAATDMTAGGVLKATTYTSPAWHMMENGLETVEVMGTDLAGNSATSASVTVTVDNIAPVIALGVPSAAYINKDGTSSIAVTVSDANLPDSVGLTPGTEGDAGVSATLEQGAFGAGATSRTGTWVVRGAVGTGAYKVSIGAGALKDKAGNASVVAPSVTVTVDNTVPEIKGFTTPEYCNKADNYSVGVTVSASDTTSGMGSYEISGADLTATVSGTLSAAAGETGSDAKSIVFSSSTADGGKTVTLKVTDLAGNSASMSAVIKLDTTPPELSASILEAAGAGDTAVATDGYVKNADYVTVKVESNETLRGYPSYAGSGAELKAATDMTAGGVLKATTYTSPAWHMMENGLETVEVMGTDLAGNSATSASVTVTVDNIAPVIALGVPSAAYINKDGTSSIAVTVSDANLPDSVGLTPGTEGDAGVSATLEQGAFGAGATSRTGTWVVRGAVGTGAYKVSIGAGALKDKAGNASVVAPSVTVTVDNTVPEIKGFTTPEYCNKADNYSVGVTVSASDTTSGMGSYEISGADLTATVSGTLSAAAGETGSDAKSIVFSSSTADGGKTVTLKVTDLAGNSASMSAVIKLDTTPPELSASILEAAGAGDTAVATDGYVKNADYVTVKVESNETLRGYPSYAGSGAELKAATDMTAGGVLKATTYTSPAWHMMENGLETVEVMGTDLAGNSATSASVTVTVDNIAPVIALGVPSAAYINKDGTSSIAVTVSDANLPDSVGLTPGTEGDAGVSATLEQGAFGAGATSRTGTWVVRGAVGTGAYKVSIGAGALKDKAGNASVVAPSVTVTVDNTVPEIKGFTTPEYCNKADNYSVGVTVSASDTTSGMGSYEISGADLTATVSGTLSAAAGETGSDAKSIVFSSSTADGGKTVTLKVTDLAGNSASMSAVIKLDNTVPEIKGFTTPEYCNKADNYSVGVTVSASDTTSGMGSYEISGADLTATVSGTLSAAAGETGSDAKSIVFSSSTADGGKTVTLKVTDLAGNSASTSAVIKLDNTVPEIKGFTTPEYCNKADNYSVGVTVSASDTTSGMGSYEISGADLTATVSGTLSAAAGETGSDAKSIVFSSSTADGGKTVTLKVTDLAGNSASMSAVIKLDNTVPEIKGFTTPEYCNKADNYSVGVTVSASDTTSGMGSYEISGADLTATVSGTLSAAAGETGSDAKSIVFSSSTADGGKTVTLKVTDLAGNSASTSAVIKLDNTVPEIKGFTTPEYCNKADNYSVGVTVSASDTTSGMGSYEISGADLTATVSGTLSAAAGETGSDAKSIVFSSSTADGGKTVTLKVTDLAGNSASMSAVIKLDNTVPEIKGFTTPEYCNKADNYSVGVTVSASDTTSGMGSYEISGADLTATVSGTLSAAAGETGSDAKSIVFSSSTADGGKTVTLKVTDLAGNSASTSAVIKLDTTPPVLNTTDVTIGTSLSYCLVVTIADSLESSGVLHYREHGSTDDSGSYPFGPSAREVTVTANGFSAVGIDFYISDAAGNKSVNYGYAAYDNDSSSYSLDGGAYIDFTAGNLWMNRIASAIYRLIPGSKSASSTSSRTASRASSSVVLGSALYGSVDAGRNAEAVLAVDEALSSDIGIKTMAVRYAIPTATESGGIDTSGLSLLKRSATSAAVASARSSATGDEPRRAAPAPSSGSAPRGSAPSPAAESQPGPSSPPASAARIVGALDDPWLRTGISAPSTVPLPNRSGPQYPARSSAPPVDLYVNSSDDRRSASSGFRDGEDDEYPADRQSESEV